MLGEFGVIVVCSGGPGGRVALAPADQLEGVRLIVSRHPYRRYSIWHSQPSAGATTFARASTAFRSPSE